MEELEDRVPSSLRSELGLPDDADVNDLDYNKIREADMVHKNRHIGWSGKDVLGDLINQEK